ncbi:butyrophilin subfamily 2 member A1-like [Mycteria americana]|uniref:butyrophilin subfamily 2 member A1-like n=1 Tax=Mycteria americana TaxID=33587 RepID=UPI003F5844B0
MGSPFWWLTAIHILTFQCRSCLITGQFISSPPNSSIIGVIGEGVVLPCHVVADNIPEVFSVQWIFHEQSQKIMVSRYDGKNKKEKQDERYQGRTEFFHSEFRVGNMSLRLKNVRSSDKGSYTCAVSFNDTYHDVLIELQVAAKGGVPSIFLRSHMKQGIGLTCHATGWFPKPEVIWLDGQGQVRKELSTTKMTMMPAGLYSVVTSMNLKPGSDMEVCCRIVNNLLNTMSESRVLISDIFFPSISKWLIIFLVILCLSMVLISTVFSKLRSNHKKTVSSDLAVEDAHVHGARKDLFLVSEAQLGYVKAKMDMEEVKSKLKKRFERLKAKLDFWEARSHAVPITVNPDCRVLELQVPGAPGVESHASEPAGPNTPSTVPILVAKEGFAAGKHYWEVEVGQQQDWVLGVVREKGRQEEEGEDSWGGLPGEDYWALHRSQGEIFSSEGDRRIEKQQMRNSVLGVLLDLEEGQVNFYEAEQMALMVRMPLRLGKEPAEMFYPFLSKREGTLTPLIHPVLIPVPLQAL